MVGEWWYALHSLLELPLCTKEIAFLLFFYCANQRCKLLSDVKKTRLYFTWEGKLAWKLLTYQDDRKLDATDHRRTDTGRKSTCYQLKRHWSDVYWSVETSMSKQFQLVFVRFKPDMQQISHYCCVSKKWHGFAPTSDCLPGDMKMVRANSSVACASMSCVTLMRRPTVGGTR